MPLRAKQSLSLELSFLSLPARGMMFLGAERYHSTICWTHAALLGNSGLSQLSHAYRSIAVLPASRVLSRQVMSQLHSVYAEVRTIHGGLAVHKRREAVD